MKQNRVVYLNSRRPQSRAAIHSRRLARKRRAAAIQLAYRVFSSFCYLALMVCLIIGLFAILAIF